LVNDETKPQAHHQKTKPHTIHLDGTPTVDLFPQLRCKLCDSSVCPSCKGAHVCGGPTLDEVLDGVNQYGAQLLGGCNPLISSRYHQIQAEFASAQAPPSHSEESVRSGRPHVCAEPLEAALGAAADGEAEFRVVSFQSSGTAANNMLFDIAVGAVQHRLANGQSRTG
jgi:hypothetical protein